MSKTSMDYMRHVFRTRNFDPDPASPARKGEGFKVGYIDEKPCPRCCGNKVRRSPDSNLSTCDTCGLEFVQVSCAYDVNPPGFDLDSLALDVAREVIADIATLESLPGGETQLKAIIQCRVKRALLFARGGKYD